MATIARRTKEQIIADSIQEGYALLLEGIGSYDAPVAEFRAQGYDVRFWYMNREKEVANRTFSIYGLLKRAPKLVPMPGIEKLAELKKQAKVFDIDPEKMNCFLKMLGVKSLASLTDVESTSKFNAKQKKAQKNIKNCANDMWAYVNSYIDNQDAADAREYLMDANALFNDIYRDSLTNVYEEGCVTFNEKTIQDIKFCGKKFLGILCFYYTAKLMSDAFYELDGTMEDAQKIMNELSSLMERVC